MGETIGVGRQQQRQLLAEHQKSMFSADVPLVVHWDGKLLRDLTGNDHVDRLPVIITGENVSQLLTVAKLPCGTGEAQSNAVCDALRDWGLESNVAGLSFDTTSSNTGWISGACVRIQQTLGRSLLFLACRHHVFELVIAAVFVKCMGVSDGPDIRIFRRFKEQWAFIDQQHYQDFSSNEGAANSLQTSRKEPYSSYTISSHSNSHVTTTVRCLSYASFILVTDLSVVCGFGHLVPSTKHDGWRR